MEPLANELSTLDKLRYTVSRAQGINIETDLTPYMRILKSIRSINLSGKKNEALYKMGAELKKRAQEGEKAEILLPETYALAAEACIRCLGLSPYDVQILTAIVLHQGKLAQMQTGEGKTLAAVFPAALNGLYGRGVHIMTANDYLARRDALWMEPVYRFLGLTTAYIQEEMDVNNRKTAYQADITYMTAREGGFDLLRDQLRYKREEIVHRDFAMAIVDEADFLLIDEARIPLVIAGEGGNREPTPEIVDSAVRKLKKGEAFNTDQSSRRIFLTRQGESQVSRLLNCGGIHEAKWAPFFAAVNVGLHAHHLLTRDVDYIIRNQKIELVDEFTGRVADKRQWPHGIQSALEAKEGLPVRPEGRIFGSISIQHYINLYPRLSAMTATAVPAAREFIQFYRMGTVIIPPDKPLKRIDAEDQLFVTKSGKLKALLEEIAKEHSSGRPILVGTASVKESLELAELLRERGIGCSVLNARNNEQEAEIIAGAGMLGAVTISTNMAGRGTDIKLGGEQGIKREEIKELGGLYVIGTNRHESVRVDNQLRGRAGRQGDPGLSRLFISLEDDLIERYGVREFIPKWDEQDPGAMKKIYKEILRAQEIIEDQNYVIRKTLRGYTALVEKQRKYIQNIRKAVLVERVFPNELWEKCRDHYDTLLPFSEKEHLNELLISLLLYNLDEFWADHLAFIEEIREGIHLQCFGGHEPLLVFIKEASEAFSGGLDEIYRSTTERFLNIHPVNGELNPHSHALRGPAGTWTYLIRDEPLPNFKVGLMASQNIGFAAMASLFVMLFSLITAFGEGFNKFLRKVFKREF